MASGLWESHEGVDFQCVAVDCGNPYKMGGQYEMLRDTSSTTCNDIGTTTIDNRCELNCTKGFTAGAGAKGASLKCGDDGLWKASTLVTECSRVQCASTISADAAPNLASEAAARTCRTAGYRDTCQTACDSGFVGPADFICSVNGLWIPKTNGMKCVPASEHGSFILNDENTGCTDPNRDHSNLLVKEIVLEREMVIWISSKMISETSGRSDLLLTVDGAVVDKGTTFRAVNTWKTMSVTWVGILAAGKHTIAVSGIEMNKGTYGCGAQWGELQAFWMSSAHAQAYEVAQLVGGCPRADPGVLITHFLDVVVTDVMVIVSGHIVHKGAGRSDLWLSIDDNIVDRGLIFAAEDQWEDAKIHWVGTLSKGTHKFQLISNTGGWGCARDGNWGDMNIMVVDQPDIFRVESVVDPSQLPCTTPTGAAEVRARPSLEADHSICVGNARGVYVCLEGGTRNMKHMLPAFARSPAPRNLSR